MLSKRSEESKQKRQEEKNMGILKDPLSVMADMIEKAKLQDAISDRDVADSYLSVETIGSIVYYYIDGLEVTATQALELLETAYLSRA